MIPAPRSNKISRRLVRRSIAATFPTLFILFLAACGSSMKVTDPQLRPIQEMLEKELPTGSSQQQVVMYLNNRAYPLERTSKEGTIIAVIRHIDTQKLQPVTARVTFYFDATNRLNTFEMERILNQPIPQSEIKPAPPSQPQPAPQQ